MSKKEIYEQIAEGLATLAEGIHALAIMEETVRGEPGERRRKASEIVMIESRELDAEIRETMRAEEKAYAAGEAKKKVTMEDIRNVLAEKSQAGLTNQVRELLERFGANKLSAVKEKDYEKLLEAAHSL